MQTVQHSHEEELFIEEEILKKYGSIIFCNFFSKWFSTFKFALIIILYGTSDYKIPWNNIVTVSVWSLIIQKLIIYKWK